MKLNETIQLQEALSSVVYHATSMSRLIGLANSNELRLSRMHDGSGTYYMSFARSRTGQFIEYLRDLSNFDIEDEAFNPRTEAYAIIEFDGRALSANYKGKPFNTFHVPGEDPEDYMEPEFNFMEDRIFSRKQTIPNANRYIRAVHVVENGRKIKPTFLDKLARKYEYVFVYDTLRDFMGAGANTRRERYEVK